jgi:hypothetical protein
MKRTSLITAIVSVLALANVVLLTQAADKKAKPYPLDTCAVTDEKIGADPGMKPYTFVHEGREIKLCCKSCLKGFKKDTAKIIAKIEAAEKKAK